LNILYNLDLGLEVLIRLLLVRHGGVVFSVQQIPQILTLIIQKVGLVLALGKLLKRRQVILVNGQMQQFVIFWMTYN